MHYTADFFFLGSFEDILGGKGCLDEMKLMETIWGKLTEN